jgi:GTP 3',8-cyclase
MIDPFGRHISYLRVSVTDRCDFRCVYCMAEDMTFLPKAELLTLEEMDRLCSAFVTKGVRKLRLTGGEPLVRKNVMWLIRRLSRHLESGALDELTLTTNGSQLGKHAAELAACGVRRVNVSIDTLDPEKFTAITRWGKLGPVLDGIKAANDAGIRVKINTVALKGVNDDEAFDLIDWAGREGHDITFIEVMPMGDIGGENRLDQYLPISLLRAKLKTRYTLEEIDYRTGGPARYVRIAETGQRVGFITPLTHNFCESCNRVRLTCTGMLYMCLGQDDSADLRAPLRASADDALLMDAIDEAISREPKGDAGASIDDDLVREVAAVADGDLLEAEQLQEIEERRLVGLRVLLEERGGTRDRGEGCEQRTGAIDRVELPVGERHDDQLVRAGALREDRIARRILAAHQLLGEADHERLAPHAVAVRQGVDPRRVVLDAAGLRVVVAFVVIAFVGLDLVFRHHRRGLRRRVFAAIVLSAGTRRHKTSADQNKADHCKATQTKPHAHPPVTRAKPRFPRASGVSILRPSH